MAKKPRRPQIKSKAASRETEAPKKKQSRFAQAQQRAQKMQSKKKKRQPREKGRIKNYFKGVKLEMKKVVWPTKQELGTFTVVVLCVCAAFALAFWVIDMGVLAGIKLIAPEM